MFLEEYNVFMSRLITFSPKEYYHCYCRGTEKRKIFLDKKDYLRFIHLLFVCNGKNKIHLSDHGKKSFDEIFGLDRGELLVNIGAYVLMPNHFHLLIREKEKGGISLFMQKLMTAYVMYFNKKYQRTGVLFEGKFRAQHANQGNYLKYLFAYIHLNPLKLINPKWKENGIKNTTEAKEFLRQYKYSSYADYLKEERVQKMILSPEEFPDYFPTKNDFEKEIFDWISMSRPDLDNIT